MPMTNAQGEPSWIDAQGTDERATNALGETYFLDPLVNQQGEENENVIIDGKDADERERDARERAEREEQSDAKRTDEQQRELVKAGESASNVGTAEGNPAPGNKGDVKGQNRSRDEDASVNTAFKGGEQTSAGTSSKTSSAPLGKNTNSK